MLNHSTSHLSNWLSIKSPDGSSRAGPWLDSEEVEAGLESLVPRLEKANAQSQYVSPEQLAFHQIAGRFKPCWTLVGL